MSERWTAPQDIAGRVRRRWEDGTLLRSLAASEPFPAVTVTIRGPRVSEIGDRLDAVRAWVSSLDSAQRSGRCYRLEWESIGGRHLGRNRLPVRAVVETYEQAWRLLEVEAEVREFGRLLELAVGVPSARSWALAHPHRALRLAAEWPQVLAAYGWLDGQRGTARYLREISAPGVDTKFVERHRAVLAAMCGVSTTPAGFLSGLGLRAKPEFVRMRVAPGLGLPGPLSELVLRTDEVRELAVSPACALVIENEITYLSVEVPPDGMVLWGKGFEVDRVGRLPWLAGTPVTYWGDIDTHGFAILDRLRAWLPQTRSVLMDRGTLVAHRERWVSEARPASSRLSRLTADESDLYDDLVSDRLGTRVRLEQERIDWEWVVPRLGP